MRKLVIVALMLTVGLAACGNDDSPSVSSDTTAANGAETTSASSTPVALAGKVTNEGMADATGRDELELEADNFYFKPTFIKVTPGQKLTLKLKNEGAAPHTFTSKALNIDKELKPDESATVEITVPDADAVAFYCRFHQGGGMQGALFTKEGASLGGDAGTTATTAAPSNGY